MTVRYEQRWPNVRLTIEEDVQKAVRDVTLAVEKQIVSNVTTAGLVDTGNYRRSWASEIGAKGFQGEVGSPVEYGVYLEYGTRFMPARAHVVPAATSVASRAASYFRRLGR